MSDVAWGPTGREVFSRTYSRIKPDGSRETWEDTVQRVVDGNCAFVDPKHIKDGERDQIFDLIYDMRNLPAGRHLSMTGVLGRQYVNNCFNSGWTEDISEHYDFEFLRLMEGGGVGSNHSNSFIARYPQVRNFVDLHLVCDPAHQDYERMFPLDIEQIACLLGHGRMIFIEYEDWTRDKELHRYEGADADDLARKLVEKRFEDYDWKTMTFYSTVKLLCSNRYTHDWFGCIGVEDTREGWAAAQARILHAGFDETVNGKGKAEIVLDFSRVRPYGTPIRTFGGTASGPWFLMMELRAQADLLNSKCKQNLTSLDTMEVGHNIGKCVISGNVRRSARLCAKHWADSDIFDFIRCKEDGISHWTSNISVAVDDEFFGSVKAGDEYANRVLMGIAEGAHANGEPGIWNQSLASKGELDKAYAPNPCGEISFSMGDLFGVCNLGHVNMAAFSPDEDAEMIQAARLMTRFLIRATFADNPDLKTQAAVDKYRRIGVGVMGYHNWLVANGIKYSESHKNRRVRGLLRKMYAAVREEAQEYCRELRIPMCIKLTTVAPTGTISHLPGVVSGIQPVLMKRFLRGVVMSDGDSNQVALVEEARKKGYPVESSVYTPHSTYVQYPCQDPIFSYGKASLIEESNEIELDDYLAVQAMFQELWADNSVSLTVNFDANKVTPSDIAAAIKKWGPKLKGTTLMPEESNRPQMPYVRLSKQAYEEFQYHEAASAEQVCSLAGCPDS